ncbi:ankyrin repeat protein [Megavirus baoshan]|uniref:Ankyrin repeat protein n=1 Tax=Megavirus baoshan TaxID=2496520 RepID=A0A3S8UXX3_9VIRU|nr:ankyrin repeat protein [Megavirus baoshan]AZL89670.1 ankyrin repeat protein [Megavirus baoshan]
MDHNIYNNLPVEIWIHIIKKIKSVNLFFCSKDFLRLLPLSSYHNNIICIDGNNNKNVLKISVENGYLNIIEHIDNLKTINSPLVKNIKKFNYDSNTLFKISCKNNHLKILNYISINYIFNNIEKEHIIKLIKYGHFNITKILLKKFCKKNHICHICNCNYICDYNSMLMEYILPTALKYYNMKIFKYFYRKSTYIKHYGFLFLKTACEFDCLDIVKYLIKKNVKYDTNNYYVIQLCLSKGHYEIAKYLLNLINIKKKNNIKNISWLDIIDKIIGRECNSKICNIISDKKATYVFKIKSNYYEEIIEEMTYKKKIIAHICENITIKHHTNIIDIIVTDWNKKYIVELLKCCQKRLDIETMDYIISSMIKNNRINLNKSNNISHDKFIYILDIHNDNNNQKYNTKIQKLITDYF